jgi:hypothetical protein
MSEQFTPEQSRQLKCMLRQQQRLLRRHAREERNVRRLLQRLSAAAAAKAPPPMLNPHERRLLQRISDEGITLPTPHGLGKRAHKRYRRRQLGTFGPASPVRRIAPKTGKVIGPHRGGGRL